MRPRCCTFGTCSKSTSSARNCFAAQNEIFEEEGWIMRGGTHRGRHDHRGTVLDEERDRRA